MKKLALLFVVLLSACSEGKPVLSYQQLVAYPKSCINKESQLKELRRIQEVKNFSDNPDDLSEEDRAYNSRLKSTIWWYTIKCNNEKIIVTYNPD